MNKKILSLICFTLLGVFSSIAGNAQEKFDTAPEVMVFIKSVAYGELLKGNGFMGGECGENVNFTQGLRIKLADLDCREGFKFIS